MNPPRRYRLSVTTCTKRALGVHATADVGTQLGVRCSWSGPYFLPNSQNQNSDSESLFPQSVGIVSRQNQCTKPTASAGCQSLAREPHSIQEGTVAADAGRMQQTRLQQSCVALRLAHAPTEKTQQG